MTEYWAIRHKPSGHFLPLRKGRSTRGFTYVEPTDKHPPRLFTRRQSAAQALGWWLEGHALATYEADSGYYFSGEFKPQSHRVQADMEIVPVRLEC